jgi:hypothetical protein
MINLPAHGLATKAQSDFPSGQEHTGAGIKPAFLLAGDLRTSFVPLPSKTARTDCARDPWQKGAREMDAAFQQKSLLADKNSLIFKIFSRQFT